MSSSNIMKQPPKFNLQKPFSRFKEEVLTWNLITSVEKKLRGSLLTLSLPDEGRYGDLREKVMESVQHAGEVDENGTNKENGLQLVLDFLEKHIGEDEVTDMCDKIRNFMEVKREDSQTVKEYCSNFEHAYQVAKSKGKLKDLPGQYMMYTMISNARITDYERKLVLSGVDLKKEETIYKETKEALLKYCGNNKDTSCEPGAVAQISAENTFFGGKFGRGQGRSSRGFPPRRPPPPIDKDFDPNMYHPQVQRDNMDTKGKKINPKKNGKIMTCDYCGSFLHLQAQCWDKKQSRRKNQTYATAEEEYDFEEEEDDEEEYETGQEELETDEDEEVEAFLAEHLRNVGLANKKKKKKSLLYYMENFTAVTFDIFHAEDDGKKKVLLDTGCVRTVCGKRWLAHVMADMNPKIKETVKSVPSHHIFKFGGGEKLPSLGTVKIPCSINGKNIILKTEVVESDIPCLLSKKSMKSARAKIDTENDLINIYGQDVDLINSSSGHYLMEIQNFILPKEDKKKKVTMDSMEKESVVLITSFEGMEEKEVMKKLKHIHQTLGHPSQRIFCQMLKNSDFKQYNPELVNKLYESCEFCFKFKKSKPVHKVSPPMASDFNHTVCMDLKIWPKTGKVILYIIDMFTRLTVAKIIPDKKPESVMKVLVNCWIYRFGSPRRVYTDNGGEFVNNKMLSLCEAYSIKFMNCGAYSPNQAGLVESNHKVCDQMIEIMMDENPNLKFEDALESAVYAKNILVNVYGYSPLQLVLGKQPRLPGMGDDGLAAMEEEPMETKTISRIAEIHSARKAFLETENSHRLKKAMRFTPVKREVYSIGQFVYFKYGTDKRWRGPGRIVAVDGKVVYIKWGRALIHTSESRVTKTAEQTGEQTAGQQSADSQTQPTPAKVKPKQKENPNSKKSTSNSKPIRRSDRLAAKNLIQSDDSDDSSDEDVIEEVTGENEAFASLDVSGVNNGTQLSPHIPVVQRPPSPQADTHHRDRDGRPAPKAGSEPGSSGQSGVQSTGHSSDQPGPSGAQAVGRPVSQINIYSENGDRNESVTESHLLGDISDNLTNTNSDSVTSTMPSVHSKEVEEFPELPRKGAVFFAKIPGKDLYQKYVCTGMGFKRTSVKQRQNPYINFRREDGSTGGLYLNKVEWMYGVEDRPAETIHNYVNHIHDTDGFDHLTSKSKILTKLDISTAYVIFIPKDFHDYPFVVEAKEKELKNFNKFHVYEEVEHEDQEYITAGWVVTEKNH